MAIRFQRCPRWLIASALVAMMAHPAVAEVVPTAASRDTTIAYSGRWRDELPAMLARVATAVDSGFGAPERQFVLNELPMIRPKHAYGRGDQVLTRSYLVQVRFRGRTSAFNMYAYWPDTASVSFYIRSPDTLLLSAIDSTFRAARMAVLSPPERVRLRLEDPFVWTGVAPSMSVSLDVGRAAHCPDFGLENHGESRGDTVAIHVVGAAPKDSCPYGYWPPQMSHRRTVLPGRYHIAIDYKGDTNRFVVDVTDSSLALSTVRSTFVTADERIRWRVPGGSFILWCGRPERELGSACDDLQAWAARQAGVERVAFDPRGVSPLRDGAIAYRYADDRTLGALRACVRTINPAIRKRSYLALHIRPRAGPWVVDQVLDPSGAPRVASDPSCGLPKSIVDYGKSFTSYPLNCPTPAENARTFVGGVLSWTPGWAQWLREHDVPVPTAKTLDPLSGPQEVARCRHVDSMSVRHPVAVFRAGRYFIATNIDGLDTLTLDGPVRGYLVWVLDSANNVVHVPGYSPRAVRSVPRGGLLADPKRPGAKPPEASAAAQHVPRDVRVTSTRSGVVLLQWVSRPTSPSLYELQRATGQGAFATIGTIRATALAAADTTALPGSAYRYRLLARFFFPGDSAASNEVRLRMPRVATPRLAWPIEPYLRPAVHGRVLDSLTGRPVPNMYLFVGGQMANAMTDSLGRYLFGGLPPGRHEVTFSCPTKRELRGHVLATRRIDLTAATDSVVDFHILLRNCAEPPLRTWSGEFRGHYSSGFESSNFTPCTPLESFAGTAYEDESRGSSWVTFSEAARVQVDSLWPRDGAPVAQYQPIFVRWRATVKGPAHYGHMGLGLYDMRVTEVLELRRTAPSDCPQ